MNVRSEKRDGYGKSTECHGKAMKFILSQALRTLNEKLCNFWSGVYLCCLKVISIASSYLYYLECVLFCLCLTLSARLCFLYVLSRTVHSLSSKYVRLNYPGQAPPYPPDIEVISPSELLTIQHSPPSLSQSRITKPSHQAFI